MKIKDIEKRLEDLTRDIEALKKNDKVWPQAGKVYWYITVGGLPAVDKYDQRRMRTSNMYRTKEDAQTVIDIDNRIHELTGDWVADWGNENQCKRCLYYDHRLGEWRSEYNTGWQQIGVTYMPEEAVDTILKEFTAEQLNLWGGVR
jgi:hypothetical protein